MFVVYSGLVSERPFCVWVMFDSAIGVGAVVIVKIELILPEVFWAI